MKELFLIILFGAILIGVNLWAARLRMPARGYYRIGAGVLLALLAWFGPENRTGLTYFLLAIAIGSILWHLVTLRRPRADR